jgi:hypothetical protein
MDKNGKKDKNSKNGVDIENLIKKLEKEGEKQVRNVNVTQATPQTFIDIMQKGADEFKEKTGRNMTYAEMRAAYG